MTDKVLFLYGILYFFVAFLISGGIIAKIIDLTLIVIILLSIGDKHE